ncbi:hypothetical protein CAPTEDRAFT_228167 [Capitella teleta]|uniref:EGF-like domain-containing protein n=1 Tax=Capitella teleta TaxID=283909 RepID=R7UJ52_CAPTE|nr:hypothetical protein CAPTEDRAFT_228167 [Capitella teleta]|eukprot:ELU03317.1 hypothetical protein CAPTEDRAFT_228167 [Capitella teleta]
MEQPPLQNDNNQMIPFDSWLSGSRSTDDRTIYTQTNWQSTVAVNEYKTYSNGQLLEYKVPPNCLQSHWLLTGYRTPKSCEDRTLIVAMQHGGFPLINPLNETFPPQFYLKRTHLLEISLLTDNATTIFKLPNPLPGSWFAMAYLGDYVDDKITPKGIGTTCNYVLAVTHMTELLDHVPSLVTDAAVDISNISGSSNAYRFLLLDKTWRYRMFISNCSFYSLDANTTALQNISSPCPLTFAVRSKALPLRGDPSTTEVTCEDETCFVDVFGPSPGSWQHVIFITPALEILVSFKLIIELDDCTRVWRSTQQRVANIVAYETNTTQTTVANSSDLQNFTLLDVNPDHLHSQNISALTSNIEHQCYIAPELGRMATANRPFQARFTMHLGIATILNRVYVVDNRATTIKFEVEPLVDSGGTLRFDAQFDKTLLVNSSLLITVDICVTRDSFPLNVDGVSCEKENYLQLNNSNISPVTLYFPYPEPGMWFVGMQAKCFANHSNTGELTPVTCSDSKIIVNFEPTLSPCVDGACGDYGSCREYFSGVLHFSSCKCVANYRGYACNDDRVAESDAAQLTATLLLTLSNFMFLPAIFVAICRRFYVEALVYTYTMFFSTFYHACDGDRHFLYCIMPYNVLGHCDFFGAIMSFWVTLVAMARMPERLRAVAFMLAALGLAMGVTWDRHSLWTFLVPCGVALGGMLLSWGYRCRQRRSCYPSKMRWLLFVLPGVLIAIVGLIIFAFFETESNYQYTHSAWHACMALCIVFILPPRRQTQKMDVPTLDESLASSITLVRCDSVAISAAEPSGYDNPRASPSDSEQNGKVFPL